MSDLGYKKRRWKHQSPSFWLRLKTKSNSHQYLLFKFLAATNIKIYLCKDNGKNVEKIVSFWINFWFYINIMLDMCTSKYLDYGMDSMITILWMYSSTCISLREKCPNTGLFLVRIFLYWGWKYSPNTGKYGPEITPYLDTFHLMHYYCRGYSG